MILAVFWLLGASGILLFGFVVVFGAPYLPVHKKQMETALDLLDLKKGQTLIDLGCGDGRVLIAAARRGVKSVGYELNPVLVVVARLRTLRFRSQVRVIWGNYWQKEWPKADAIFVFLLEKYMKKLDKKITQYSSNNNVSIKLASYAFQIPKKKPQKQLQAVFLYQYLSRKP